MIFTTSPNTWYDCDGSRDAPLSPRHWKLTWLPQLPAKPMNGIWRNCDELSMYEGKPNVVGMRPAPGASWTSFIRVKLNRTSSTVLYPRVYTSSIVAPQFSRVKFEPVATLPK